MMLKKVLVNLFVVALVAFHGYGQDKSQKAEWLSGVVVAYDAIKAETPCYGECERSLIVRLEAGKEEKPQYIRVDVRIQEGQDFPPELIAHKRQWRLRVTRTTSLDEPIYDYVVKNATAYSKETRYPIWKLIPGAEGENLPFGEKIPSYTMSKNAFKAFSSQ